MIGRAEIVFGTIRASAVHSLENFDEIRIGF